MYYCTTFEKDGTMMFFTKGGKYVADYTVTPYNKTLRVIIEPINSIKRHLVSEASIKIIATIRCGALV